MILLPGLDTFFLGKVLGEHPAPLAVRACAVHCAHRSRESFDMVEVLARIGTQGVERQAPFGPGLIKRMAQHGAFRDLFVDPG
jgi:hypothetical protein